MSKTLSAHLALFLVNTLYGASHLLAKGVMPDYLPPSTFILIRVSGATLLFWIVKLIFVREKIERKDLLLLAGCGLCGVAVNQMFFFHGLSLSSSINSGIIMAINPILVVILSYFIIKEKIAPLTGLGIFLGAMGAVLLTMAGGTGKGDSILGDTFLFINAASYAVYLVIAKPLMTKYSPLTVITYVFTFGLMFVMMYQPAWKGLTTVDFSKFPAEIWFKIGYVIIGVTFFTYLLTMYGLQFLSASISSAYIYVQPVMVIFFAFILGAIGLVEDYTGTITLEKIGYMLLIFLGVYLTSHKTLRNKIAGRKKRH